MSSGRHTNRRAGAFCGMLLLLLVCASGSEAPDGSGLASWYGESHRGKLMANGKPFNPDRLTAASWFHPLGTRVRVSTPSGDQTRTVIVTITDRGPARKHVADGRIIDLARAAFEALADPQLGLVQVTVEPLP